MLNEFIVKAQPGPKRGRLAGDKRIHSTSRDAMNASDKSCAGWEVKRSRVCRGHIDHESRERGQR